MSKLVDATAINKWGQITANDSNGRAYRLTPIIQVSLSSSLNPARIGDKIRFTATLSSINGPPPDGDRVTFMDWQTVIGQAKVFHGAAKFWTGALAPGQHSIRAVFSGDAIYPSSKSVRLLQVVAR
jgi:Big-like domain-containing protein